MPGRLSKFQNAWLNEFSWLAKVDNDVHKAKCKLRNAQFTVATLGRLAITQHNSTVKHRDMENAASKTAVIDQIFASKGNQEYSNELVLFIHLNSKIHRSKCRQKVGGNGSYLCVPLNQGRASIQFGKVHSRSHSDRVR